MTKKVSYLQMTLEYLSFTTNVVLRFEKNNKSNINGYV